MNDEAHQINIEVILALPERAYRVRWQSAVALTARAAVHEAVARGLPLEAAGLDPATAPLGIFSEKVQDAHLLEDGERLEVYRPLQQDPKERRRREAVRNNE